MKYKVGDKVRVKGNLIVGKIYGGLYLNDGDERHIGKETTVTEVEPACYRLDVDNSARAWTEEMLEPVEEMSAEEATRILGEICCGSKCVADCPIRKAKGSGIACREFRRDKPEEVLKVLKQWKADHEEKPIETEFANIVRVIENTGSVRTCVYEEEIPYSEDLEEVQVRVLKKYCEKHDGKFIAVIENICRVKE